jgi:hypothetical protein
MSSVPDDPFLKLDPEPQEPAPIKLKPRLTWVRYKAEGEYFHIVLDLVYMKVYRSVPGPPLWMIEIETINRSLSFQVRCETAEEAQLAAERKFTEMLTRCSALVMPGAA